MKLQADSLYAMEIEPDLYLQRPFYYILPTEREGVGGGGGKKESQI